MNSGRKDDRFPDSDVLWHACKIGDDEHVHVVSSETLAQDRLPHLVFVLKGADLVDKLAHVGVGVGVAVRKGDCVVVVLGGPLEGECVIHLAVSVVGSRDVRII